MALDRAIKRRKPAITHYRTLEAGQETALLELTLETGRKNQLRVQLSEAGHPIVGDQKYHAQTDPARRLALHAGELKFRHPVTGETLHFKNPMPLPCAASSGADRRHLAKNNAHATRNSARAGQTIRGAKEEMFWKDRELTPRNTGLPFRPMKKIAALFCATVLTSLVAFAGEKFPDISHEELKKAIADKSVTLIDVNGTDSYKEGHIPGAINFESAQPALKEKLPANKDALVVAYCGNEQCGAYAAAAKAARELGYTNVKHYSKGIAGWKSSGEKTEKGS